MIKHTLRILYNIFLQAKYHDFLGICECISPRGFVCVYPQRSPGDLQIPQGIYRSPGRYPGIYRSPGRYPGIYRSPGGSTYPPNRFPKAITGFPLFLNNLDGNKNIVIVRYLNLFVLGLKKYACYSGFFCGDLRLIPLSPIGDFKNPSGKLAGPRGF